MKIVCKRNGQEIEFKYGFPLWVEEVEGITNTKFDIQTEKPSDFDGEIYMGSTAEIRNIVITAQIKNDHLFWRERMFQFFQPRSKGTLYYYDLNTEKKIDYYVEEVTFDFSGRIRKVEVSLLCPNPLFQSVKDDLTQMAVWKGLIEWPLDLPPTWEVGEKVSTLIANVANPSNVTRGLTIRFMAGGTVHNPSLFDINRQQGLKINIELHLGDVLEITTGNGEKRVKLIRDGIITNINNLWEFGSTWLQAEPGDNVYRYDAEVGIDVLSVSIISTPLYWGA
ncbi:MAG: phage tail family protein [Clostridiales bacterium]|jgi:hypothetical protein|nr:phage tail family protein [Clostridiales bacterium]